MATPAYAPYTPQVLGDSWVPILQEEYTPTITQERGYWMNLSATTTVVTARAYVDRPPAFDILTSLGVNLYPEAGLANMGPMEQVIVPATFYTSIVAGTVVATNGTTGPAIISALENSGDDNTVLFGNGAVFGLSFTVSSYAAYLSGKRIMNVEFLYGSDNQLGTSAIGVYAQGGGVMSVGTLASFAATTTADGNQIFSASLGQYSPFSFMSTTYPSGTGSVDPWTYTINRFDPTVALAQRIYVLVTGSGTLTYAALRITYCNETRLACGGRQTGNNTGGWTVGNTDTPCSIGMASPDGQSAAPALPPGNYFVTTQLAYVADQLATYNNPFTLRALHQAYEQPEPGIHGVTIDYPQLEVGNEMTISPTDNIVAISLHDTITATVADSHAYTRQLVAPVYGTTTASQGIVNNAVAAATSYPQVRFYARRRGATTSPLGLRLQSTPTTAVSIDVGSFDALDEIVDGWRQVDLTFTSAIPTFNTSGVTTYEFFSDTNTGSRWEVLGAWAYGVSGLVPREIGGTNALGSTTYGGIAAVANWNRGDGVVSPGSNTGDLTLLFANMPQVTGLEVDVASLELAVTDECDQAPGGIPTDVFYHDLTWSGASGGVAGDSFERTAVSSGWGTSTSRAAWTVASGASSVWSTNGSQGLITPGATSTSYISVTDVSALNSTVEATVSVPAILGTQSNVYLLSRFTNTSNWYAGRFTFNTDGTVSVGIERNVAGSGATVVSPVNSTTYGPGVAIKLKFTTYGATLMAKSWRASDPEPPYWFAVATDTNLTTAGFSGMRAFVGTTAAIFTVDDFTAQWGFGAFELQRRDQWTDWQTIMLSTDPTVASFMDLEARVGVESEYRIRACHELDFCGDWSSTVASTIPAPGVDGVDVGSDLLIFTSNIFQDGSNVLAYSEIYDGTPAQTFAFLEAGSVNLQPMYLRDYQVAYHGTERGGQSFSRTILFNNAAVSLANFEQAFQSLRDLAWDSAPYVCVRDQHGSRWLANVVVPSGTIQPPFKSLWFTEVVVTEVTGTAYPVDPT